MDSERQEQTRHLERLALAELEVANRQLADAGSTIEELRSDVLALAVRLDEARKATATQSQGELAREAAREAQEQDRAAEIAELKATISRLEEHIARLKAQLDRPARQVVNKALRRGRYAKSHQP